VASSIDATKPTAGAALTADVRNNFSAAKTEIEALQAAVASALVAKAGDTMTGALNWAATQTIASAATTDIGAATSNSVIVSGTKTITGLGTIAAGAERVVQFSGALTLTHNETSLILPGGASITTAAGDVAYFVSLGSGNWRCTGYQKANGQAVVASGGTGDFKSDGTVAMTGAIQTTVGTMTSSVADGASAVAFNKNTVALANSAALIERWQNNSVTKAAIRYTGSLQLPAGSATNVSIDFGNQNTGIYNETQNGVLGVSYANQCMFSAGAIGAFLHASIPFGWSSTSSASTNNPDTRLYRGAAGRVDVCSTNSSTYGDVKLRNLIASGNLALGIVAKTANYTVTANDGVIECDATSGAITLTLPAVSGARPGATYTLKKTDANANAVTFDGNASETIDGATTVSTTTQHASITIIRNAAGTAWITLKD